MPRVPEEIQQKREQTILSTAKAMFLEKGYERTTIDDIVNKLNFGKGTFYYHFKSKNDLVISICEQIVSDLASQLVFIRDNTELAIGHRLEKALNLLLDSFHDNEEIGPHMLARIAKHTGITPDDL